ncbi:MAG: hypothetical protein M3024_08000 [Candidatus Dormibacteraeota bacterium]|nr:hypothetical protein [Candidatus Dormibacteraeota bacterium]
MRRRAARANGSLDRAVAETATLIDRLLRERKELAAENLRLRREVDRLSTGWEQVRRLARSAPRRTARRR